MKRQYKEPDMCMVSVVVKDVIMQSQYESEIMSELSPDGPDYSNLLQSLD